MPKPSRSKFSKFYFPGMISLVLLPLVCVIYLFADRIIPKYGRMELITSSKQEFSELKKGVFKPADMDDVHTYRKYSDLLFTGNAGHDAEEHARLKVLLGRLNKTTDHVTGIRVTFGTHSKYHDMVEALDSYYQNCDNLNGFVMIDDQMFIYQSGIIKPATVYIPPCGGIKQLVLPPKSLTFSQELRQLFKFWPSAIVLIAMIYFAVSKKRYYFSF